MLFKEAEHMWKPETHKNAWIRWNMLQIQYIEQLASWHRLKQLERQVVLSIFEKEDARNYNALIAEVQLTYRHVNTLEVL